MLSLFVVLTPSVYLLQWHNGDICFGDLCPISDRWINVYTSVHRSFAKDLKVLNLPNSHEGSIMKIISRWADKFFNSVVLTPSTSNFAGRVFGNIRRTFNVAGNTLAFTVNRGHAIVLLARIASFVIGGMKATTGCSVSGHVEMTASSGKAKVDRPWDRSFGQKTMDRHRTKDELGKESAAVNVVTQKYAMWCATAALSSDSTLLDLWIIKKSGKEELCLWQHDNAMRGRERTKR